MPKLSLVQVGGRFLLDPQLPCLPCTIIYDQTEAIERLVTGQDMPRRQNATRGLRSAFVDTYPMLAFYRFHPREDSRVALSFYDVLVE